MSDGDALLRAILDDPDDDAPRLVYADSLDEHGEAPRAAFIRAQVRLARLPTDHPDRPRLFQTERALRRTHHQDWVSWLPDWVWGPLFRRGFVEVIRGDTSGYLAGADEIRQRTPLTGVRLIGQGELALPLFRSRALEGIRLVELESPFADGFTASTWESLVASPYLDRLIELDLKSNRSAGAELIAALLASNPLPALRALRLKWFGLRDEDVATLAGHPWARRLRVLDLGRNLIGEAGGRALAESPHLTGLEMLGLRGNAVAASGRAVHLLRQRFGSRLWV